MKFVVNVFVVCSVFRISAGLVISPAVNAVRKADDEIGACRVELEFARKKIVTQINAAKVRVAAANGENAEFEPVFDSWSNLLLDRLKGERLCEKHNITDLNRELVEAAIVLFMTNHGSFACEGCLRIVDTMLLDNKNYENNRIAAALLKKLPDPNYTCGRIIPACDEKSRRITETSITEIPAWAEVRRCFGCNTCRTVLIFIQQYILTDAKFIAQIQDFFVPITSNVCKVLHQLFCNNNSEQPICYDECIKVGPFLIRNAINTIQTALMPDPFCTSVLKTCDISEQPTNVIKCLVDACNLALPGYLKLLCYLIPI